MHNANSLAFVESKAEDEGFNKTNGPRWLSSCSSSTEGNNTEGILQKKIHTRWKADRTCKNPRSGVK